MRKLPHSDIVGEQESAAGYSGRHEMNCIEQAELTSFCRSHLSETGCFAENVARHRQQVDELSPHKEVRIDPASDADCHRVRVVGWSCKFGDRDLTRRRSTRRLLEHFEEFLSWLCDQRPRLEGRNEDVRIEIDERHAPQSRSSRIWRT